MKRRKNFPEPTHAIQLLLIIFIAILPGVLHAVEIDSPADNDFHGNDTRTIRQVITFEQNDLVFEIFKEFDMVSLEGCIFLDRVGEPLLPCRQINVALPEGMRATQVSIESTTSVNLDGTYTIVPSQPPRAVSAETSSPASIFGPNADVYSSNRPYPGSLLTLDGQTDLAGQPMAQITITPLQYLPARGSLKLYTSITFVIEGKTGNVCGDYLPPNFTLEQAKNYESMAREMVINPDRVCLAHTTTPQNSSLENGDYDYVVITSSSWDDDFSELVDWKTKKGVPATTVTTDWIYFSAGYSGSDVEKIRAFVADAYATWGTTYFLMGGDTATVPAHSRPMLGDDIPNDTYYADFDDDWTCEVHVGRASVVDMFAIETFINKVMTYEKNPPLNDYAKRVAFLGFDLDESTDGEENKEYIDTTYLPSDWTLTTVYDSATGNHESNVISTVNSGQHVINHIDHCNQYSLGVGYTNHSMTLSTAEVDAFTNGARQSIFYSIGCWANAFDFSNCIAEHFVRDTNGGGVAFVGNSRYGWYSVGSMATYSNLYDRHFFNALFGLDRFLLGECFSLHKNNAPKSNDHYKYIFTELTLLGDPELPLWADNPQDIDTVSYSNSIDTGSQSFSVTVSTATGPVEGAVVCVMKNGEIYERGSTDVSGEVNLLVNPLTEGSMDITVTGLNLLPWEGTCEVTAGGAPPETVAVSIDANPSSGTLPFSTQFTVELTNLTQESRRAAARINVTIGNGSGYQNWKSGWTNLAAGETFSNSWMQNFPPLGSIAGGNVFLIVGEDVTPAPYNQAPNAPSGDTDTASVTVSAAIN